MGNLDKERILVVGATGFIGSAIVARLACEGAYVIAMARQDGTAARRLAADDTRFLDMARISGPVDWLPHLQGITSVINCAGTLQDGARDTALATHVTGPGALFAACETAGVARVIHFSAMGTDKGALSSFSDTKARAEFALKRSSLSWTIVRPSVVVGNAAYGGSALFRGLASLPWVPAMPYAGRISVVQLPDVVDAVVFMLSKHAPSRISIDLIGPESLSFESVIARYRAWLGWKPARVLHLPDFVLTITFVIGDVAGWLGWRPAVRSNARAEMQRGASGDPAHWEAITGIKPSTLDQALAAHPASVQERWFARLFMLKPLVFCIFAAFWLLTGFISLGPGYDIGLGLMLEGGAGALSGPTVVAGGIADLLIGIGILWRSSARYALWAALALTVFYLVTGSVLLPRLWEDPLGPMMKVWPILALNLVALAILDER